MHEDLVSLGAGVHFQHVSSLAQRIGFAGPLVFTVLVLALVIILEYQRNAGKGQDFWGHRVTFVFASVLIVLIVITAFAVLGPA